MKVADMELEDLLKPIQTMIQSAITQSEMRVIDLLSDRMDEGLAELRQEINARFQAVDDRFDAMNQKMDAGFSTLIAATDALGRLIDSDYKKLDKRLTCLEHKAA